jgi:hypothetical protein
MTKDELYNDLKNLSPIDREKYKGDYKKVLKDSLKEFLKLLTYLDDSEKNTINNIKWDDFYKDISDFCNALNDIVAKQYEGLHSTAYAKIKNQLLGRKGKKPKDGLLKMIELYTIAQNDCFFRMRTSEYKKDIISYKEMFHIPLDKRGVVKTQRYSMPGYPCLYLGKSIYGCWEEMDRPAIDKCMVSYLINSKELKLFDLRVPSKTLWDSNIDRVLRIFPLIIACMIPIINREDTYKPEYIIPQLLTEFIIFGNSSTNKKDKIYGIYYTSALKKDVHFEFPDEVRNNIAIPILKPLNNTRYCKELCDIFEITNSTCDEYERLIGRGCDAGQFGLTPEQQLIENYELSDFGFLEKRLKDRAKFPLYKMKPDDK